MAFDNLQRALFVFNPRSGKGRAARTARDYALALQRQGLTVELLDLTTLNALPEGAPATGVGAVIVFGGDGTVHSASAIAAHADAPIYQVPFGTENLFARAFGMTQSFSRLRGALLSGKTTTIDTAECAGRPFLLMCSAGPDASIVHRVAARRTGTISHLSYAGPIIAESLAPSLPPVTVRVDGQTLVEGERGLVFVANCRQYAMGLDPAHSADPTDGLLDAVFLPASNSAAVLAWSARLALGIGRNGASRRAKGRRVEIISEAQPAPVQIDGEAPPADPSHHLGAKDSPRLMTPVDIEIRPARLKVLLPSRI